MCLRYVSYKKKMTKKLFFCILPFLKKGVGSGSKGSDPQQMSLIPNTVSSGGIPVVGEPHLLLRLVPGDELHLGNILAQLPLQGLEHARRSEMRRGGCNSGPLYSCLI